MAINKSRSGVWEFGRFRLNESERQLLRDGQPVTLTPKVFDTLIALVERSGRLVEKEELMARLWPDTFVEEGALTRNISDLRKALGEEKHIETVPKRGYRFVAPVREIDEGVTLIVEKMTEAHLVIEEEEESPPSDAANRYGKPFVVLAPNETAKPLALSTTSQPPAVSSQERIESKRSLKTRLPVILGLSLLIAGSALGLREFFKSRARSDTGRNTIHEMQVSRFTVSGNVLTAAISPDGKYVATVLDESGLQSLWVRQVAANTSSIRLIAPAQVDYWGLTFSNDSNFIYYVSWVRNESDAVLYQLPVLGGTARRLPTMPIDTPINFSPAGDRFAYVTSTTSKGESYVNLANADGSGIETLVKRRQPGFFAAYPGGPAWSPDGGSIAYAASGLAEDNRQHMYVFVANVENKTERQLTAQGWGEIGRVAWLGDASGLVISAREQKDAPRQLWFLSYPDGAAHKITNDLHDYDSVSLSSDAKTLAAVQIQAAFSISVAPQGGGNHTLSDLANPSPIFSEVSSGRERIAWTPDHHLVYCSRVSGNWDIWIMNKDGSEQKQLTVDAHNDLFPAVSADGRYIYFASDRAGAFNIWRMEIDGSQPTQLTRGVNQIMPEVTPDGQWLVYQQGLGLDEPSIWRVATTGGEPELLVKGMTQRPAASPDGRLLAYVSLEERGWGLAVRPLAGGEASRKFPFPPTIGSRIFRWTPDGEALAYIVNDKEASNIWLQPLSGAPPKPLTNFKSGQLLSFAWSPDGQWLACMHQQATSDVLLLRDFK